MECYLWSRLPIKLFYWMIYKSAMDIFQVITF